MPLVHGVFPVMIISPFRDKVKIAGVNSRPQIPEPFHILTTQQLLKKFPLLPVGSTGKSGFFLRKKSGPSAQPKSFLRAEFSLPTVPVSAP